jgi:hypothetical protein
MEPNPMTTDTAGPLGYDPAGRPVLPADAPPLGGGGAYGTDVQRAAREWIVENQTLAILAGFALGVFIGALMRR